MPSALLSVVPLQVLGGHCIDFSNVSQHTSTVPQGPAQDAAWYSSGQGKLRRRPSAWAVGQEVSPLMTTSWLSKLLLHTICRSVPRPQPPRLTTSIGPCADPDLWAHLGDSTSVSRTLGNQQPAAFSLHSWGEKDTCPITETISPEAFTGKFCHRAPGLPPLPQRLEHTRDFRLSGAGREPALPTPSLQQSGPTWSFSKPRTSTQSRFLTSLYMLMGS